MTKINSQQLVDHAADLLDDKNNFKVYFDDFVLEYYSGLISIQLDTYDQAVGFNLKKRAHKVVACVENVSSFTISEFI